jgi:hypothetical protein
MSVNATLLFVPPSRVEPVGMMPIAQHILEFGNDNPLILVSGDERAEGALIASVALLNSTRTHYVLRAGQQLSKSNFMGTRYEGRFETAEEVAIWLHDSGIGWVVINNSPNAKKIPHNDLLIEAVTNQGAEEWERVMDQNGHGGIVSLYKLSTASPSTSQIEKLLERVKPSS